MEDKGSVMGIYSLDDNYISDWSVCPSVCHVSGRIGPWDRNQKVIWKRNRKYFEQHFNFDSILPPLNPRTQYYLISIEVFRNDSAAVRARVLPVGSCLHENSPEWTQASGATFDLSACPPDQKHKYDGRPPLGGFLMFPEDSMRRLMGRGD